MGLLGKGLRAPFHQIEGLGIAVSSTSGSGAELRSQTHFGHEKAQENALSGCKYHLVSQYKISI